MYAALCVRRSGMTGQQEEEAHGDDETGKRMDGFETCI